MQACGEGKRRKHAGSGSHNAFQPGFFSNPFIFLDWNGILIEGEVPPAFPDTASEAKPEYSGKELYQKAKKIGQAHTGEPFGNNVGRKKPAWS